MSKVEIKRILCAVDFSDFSAEACRYAFSLAQHYQAKLFFLHVVEMWKYPSASFAGTADLYSQYCHSLTSDADEQLREFVKAHARGGADIEYAVREGGFASDCVYGFAVERAVDVIVMGTHGRRGFDRLMLGSVTERVVRQAHCPVLSVRTAPSRDPGTGADEGIQLRRILFSTDFSDYANQALDYAASLAAKYNSELMLVHVLEEPDAEAAKRADERLKAFISAETRGNLRVSTSVPSGRAYREIVRLAEEEKADLIVMAVRGHNALDLAVFGSTAYRVIHLASCPVLAVRA